MEPFDALSLCAEVAVAILGFSGIVVVFGRYAYEEDRQSYFHTLFRGTLSPLGIIAIGSVLDAAALGRGLIWQTCSALHVVILCTILVRVRSTAQPGYTPTLGQILTGIGAFVVLGLSMWNAVSLHSFWPVLTAVWWSIGVSLFAFVNLIFSKDAARRDAKADSA